MNIKLIPVNSSALTHVGHNAATDELHVRFKGGRDYIVPNVNAEEYTAFLNCESLGKHYNQHFASRGKSKVEP